MSLTENLELLMHRVEEMRELQKEFFNGKRSVLSEAKRKEGQVDAAVAKLKQMGYSTEKYKQRKPDQSNLF